MVIFNSYVKLPEGTILVTNDHVMSIHHGATNLSEELFQTQPQWHGAPGAFPCVGAKFLIQAWLDIASGKHTKNYGKSPFIVDFSIKNGDFP